MRNGGKYRLAVGLQYGGAENEVPSISINAAAGDADQVIKIARRFGVPVIEKPALARSLHALEQDQQIPEELFEAVAAVLNQIESHTGGLGSRKRSGGKKEL